MLRPSPYPEAERVVTIWQSNTREGIPRDDVMPGSFFDWRERATAFGVVAAADPTDYGLLTPDGRPETVFAVAVTERFFDALGVEAYRGRLFAPEHHRPGSGNYAILTHGFWQRRSAAIPRSSARASRSTARRRTFQIVGQPPARPGEEAQIVTNQATPGYFRTLGFPAAQPASGCARTS